MLRTSRSRDKDSHGSFRLVAAMLAALFLGVLLLVQHTRSLAAAHADVASLFSPGDTPRHRVQQKHSTSPSPSPTEYCAPDTVSGVVGVPQTELWGDVIVSQADGSNVRDTPGSAACCALCAASKSCNTWVYCTQPAACGSQCWLKRQPSEAQLRGPAHAVGPGVPWTSGVLLGKALDVEQVPIPDGSIEAVEIVTSYGGIKLRLRPDWSNSSVVYVTSLAAHPELCTDACAFYRVEPGFLLQGSLRARLPPNKQTTPGPRHMVRGDCGWAGGSAGPDFFCYLGTEPATHWGYDHTVWAEIADANSFAVAETINAIPPKPTKPGEMHLLEKQLPLDIRVASI
jgi:PAN domain